MLSEQELARFVANAVCPRTLQVETVAGTDGATGSCHFRSARAVLLHCRARALATGQAVTGCEASAARCESALPSRAAPARSPAEVSDAGCGQVDLDQLERYVSIWQCVRHCARAGGN